MIFGIKKTGNFDPYKVFLAIATNIPQRLKTGFVVQGHIWYSSSTLSCLWQHTYFSCFVYLLIQLCWGVILYAICAAAVCLKYSQHRIAICIGSSKFLYLPAAAAAIIHNYSNNQQKQQFSRSSVADLLIH